MPYIGNARAGLAKCIGNAYRMQAMHGVKRAIELAGGQARLAAKLGVTQPTVSEWANDPRVQVPPKRCVQIERLFGGEVRRWHLRPNDWFKLWPELLGVKGAPRVARSAIAD